MAELTPAQRSLLLELHGRSLTDEKIRQIDERLVDLVGRERSSPQLPCVPRASDHVVGILGAGVGGLYAGLILQSLDIPFEILESSESRVGGRLFTHHFKNGGKYDYFDLGAMRYPMPKKVNGEYGPGIMKRLGELFMYLDMEDKLLDYHFKSKGRPGFMYFNGRRERVDAKDPDFDEKGLGIEPDLVTLGVSRITDDVLGPFANLLRRDVQSGASHLTCPPGWRTMMRNDNYSTRAYMMFKYIPSATFGLAPEHLEARTVNWCETFDTSTGSYDRALTGSVLESIAFDLRSVEWKCIDGGSSVLPETMWNYLKDKLNCDPIVFDRSVTAIGLKDEDEEDSEAGPPMVVTTANGQRYEYSHVISTLPLPVLRTINLTDSELSTIQTNALRQLQYGPSTKIGIRFKEAWWTEKFDIIGGQSYTDLPIRTIVYPSYGTQPGAKASTTLIASYCWTSDAERLGSLINTGVKKYDDKLEKLVLENLAEVHGLTYRYLKSRFVEIFAYDWNKNPETMGAFALYGPGNFQDMYKHMCSPAAEGRLHFAGEALSVRHAWVVGALDSAWRAVYEYLLVAESQTVRDKFFEKWGKNQEWFSHPDGPRSGSDGESSLMEKVLKGCRALSDAEGTKI